MQWADHIGAVMFDLLKSAGAAVLIALAPAVSLAQPSASLQVSVVPAAPPGPVHVVQGKFLNDNSCSVSHSFTLPSPIQPGDAIIGAFQWEAPAACSGGVGDTVTVGSQQATILQSIDPNNFGNDHCCASTEYFVLFNVSGTQSAVTISSSNGSPINNIGVGLVTEISGLSSTASVDDFSGNFVYNPPGAGTLTSGPITPSTAGDFLYGFQVSTYFGGTLSLGTGWIAGPNSAPNGNPCCYAHSWMDEYITNYNSTSPVAATFGLSSGNGEWWTGIIAIKPQ